MGVEAERRPHSVGADALDKLGDEQVSLRGLLALRVPRSRRQPQEEEREVAKKVGKAGSANTT